MRTPIQHTTKYNNKTTPHTILTLHTIPTGTPYSFVLALNINYEGGGTQFFKNKHNEQIYKAKSRGSAVVFNGKNPHSGVKVTSGVRYILTGFINHYRYFKFIYITTGIV